MDTLNIFLILLGASGLSSKRAEREGHKLKFSEKPKGQLLSNFYSTKNIPDKPATTPSLPQPPPVMSKPQRLDWPVFRLEHDQLPSPEGSFYHSFETDNGISVVAYGRQKALGSKEQAQDMEGEYSYTAPDGTDIVTRWYADETGFHAKVKYYEPEEN